MPPFKVEDLPATRASGESEEDDGIEERRFTLLAGVEEAGDFFIVEDAVAP
jgi:hypothetical protein